MMSVLYFPHTQLQDLIKSRRMSLFSHFIRHPFSTRKQKLYPTKKAYIFQTAKKRTQKRTENVYYNFSQQFHHTTKSTSSRTKHNTIYICPRQGTYPGNLNVVVTRTVFVLDFVPISFHSLTDSLHFFFPFCFLFSAIRIPPAVAT